MIDLEFESCEESVVNPRETLCYDNHTQLTHPTVLRHSSSNNNNNNSSGGGGGGGGGGGETFLVTCYDTIVVEVTALVNASMTCSMAIAFGPKSKHNKRAVKDACNLSCGLGYAVYEALQLASRVRRDSSHALTCVLIMTDDAGFVKSLEAKARDAGPLATVLGLIRKAIHEAGRQGLKIKFWYARIPAGHESWQLLRLACVEYGLWANFTCRTVQPSVGTEVDKMAADVLPEDDASTYDPALSHSPIEHGFTHASDRAATHSPVSYDTDEISHFALDDTKQRYTTSS